VFLVPQVDRCLRNPSTDFAQYPTIKAVYENLLVIPEVAAASPKNQPDYKAE
jgi:hypothetical protein